MHSYSPNHVPRHIGHAFLSASSLLKMISPTRCHPGTQGHSRVALAWVYRLPPFRWNFRLYMASALIAQVGESGHLRYVHDSAVAVFRGEFWHMLCIPCPPYHNARTRVLSPPMPVLVKSSLNAFRQKVRWIALVMVMPILVCVLVGTVVCAFFFLCCCWS